MLKPDGTSFPPLPPSLSEEEESCAGGHGLADLDPDAEPNPDLTPNQLVNEALTSMRNEVAHLLKSFGKQIEVVGEAAGQPVYFARLAGYYFWSPRPHEELMLDINLCFPSYPCGW